MTQNRSNQSSLSVAAVLAACTFLGSSAVHAQQFWRTDGTSGTWTGSNWSATATPTGGSAWVSGSNAVFNANSAVTFATATVGDVTVADGVTVTATAGGTLSTGSTSARTYNIGTGSTLTWSGQGVSAAASQAGFIKSGAGTWDIGAQANAYNAANSGFTLNAGTVIVGGNNAFGGPSSVLTINGGVIQSSGTRAFANPSIVVGGNFGNTGTGTATFSGTVALGSATRTITNNTTSGSRIYSGVVSGATGSGLTFIGSGAGDTSFTNAANTFTGDININGGEVRFTSDGSMGNAANAIIIDGGRFAKASDATTVTIGANRTIAVGDGVGTGISTPSSGILIYNGAIANKAGETGAWAKQGSGTLQLGGASTYTGDTAINNGTVQLTTGNDRLPTGTTVSLGQAASTNVGTFDLNGRNQQIAGLNSTTGLNATTSNNTLTSVAAAILTLGGSGSYSYGDGTDANSGVVTGAISVVKSGSGTQTFGDANTYTGSTTISNGIFQLGSASVGTVGAITSSAVGTGTLTISGGTLSSNGSTARTILNAYTLGGDATLGNATNSGTLTLSAAGTLTGNRTLTIDSAVTLGGAIGESGGARSLTKAGSGTLTLSAINTYSGTTTISAGTLSLGASGSLASPTISVASGSWFDVTAKTTGFSLGSGQQMGGRGTILGSLEFGSGSTLAFDSSGPMLIGAGTLSFAVGFAPGSLIGLSSSTPEAIYQLFSQTTGGSINTANLSNFGSGSPFDLGNGKAAYFTADSTSLAVVVVPEPSAFTLVGLGVALAGLGAWRRRRTAAALQAG